MSLINSPTVRLLEARLKAPRPSALGYWMAVTELVSHVPGCDLGEYPAWLIAEYCEWYGDAGDFVQAMIDVGVLAGGPSGELYLILEVPELLPQRSAPAPRQASALPDQPSDFARSSMLNRCSQVASCLRRRSTNRPSKCIDYHLGKEVPEALRANLWPDNLGLFEGHRRASRFHSEVKTCPPFMGESDAIDWMLGLIESILAGVSRAEVGDE